MTTTATVLVILVLIDVLVLFGLIFLTHGIIEPLQDRVRALEGETVLKDTQVEETASFLHGDFFAPTGTDPR